MKFKEFFITENVAYLAKELGNLLSSLQEYQEELKSLEKIPKKRLNNICNSTFNKIKSILLSGNIPKQNSKEIRLLQKICFTLHKIEKNELDYKQFFPIIVKSLEQVITGFGMPINNVIAPDASPIQDKDSLDKTEKEQQVRVASDKAPVNSKMVASDVNPTAPNVQADQLYAQPLGGSSGPLSAF